MWDMIAKEMNLPWRAVESMHWHMGAEEMAQRANVAVFQSVFPSPTVTYSKNPPTGLKRKAPSISPTIAGGGASDSSERPATRSRRSISSGHRRRNDSKFREEKGEYASMVEDDSPGGVPLPPQEEEQAVLAVQETPGSNGDEGWKEMEAEGGASLRQRSRSLSSGRSGGSGPQPEVGMKQES
jgi:hypothetical protein